MRREPIDTTTEEFSRQVRGFRDRIDLSLYTGADLRGRRKAIYQQLDDSGRLSAERHRLLVITLYAINAELQARYAQAVAPIRVQYSNKVQRRRGPVFFHKRKRR